MRHFFSVVVLLSIGFGQNWEVEKVTIGGASSIATDTACQPHIAFGDRAGFGYAIRTGDSWRIVYPQTISLVQELNLCLDSEELPNIGYIDGRYVPPYLDSVRYAFYDGDTWHFETVLRRDTGEAGIGCLTFALARDRTPHLVFVHDNKVKYAYKSTDTWNILTVPAEQPDTLKNLASVGFDLDTSGLPGVAVSWFKRDVGVFTSFFEFDGTGWHRFDFDSLPPGGGGTRVQNDPATDLFHILYGRGYAIGKGREWWIGEGPPGLPVAWRSFAVFQGEPHVIFSHPMNCLWYFRREAGGWVGEKVIPDRSADCGSITVDRTGRPHIAFHYFSAETLWYARRIFVGADEPPLSSNPKLYEFQLSPNPFTKTATIRYQLPVAAPVRILAFDITGRTVATIFDQNQPAGTHQLLWQPEGLAQGIYFIRIETSASQQTTSVLLLK